MLPERTSAPMVPRTPTHMVCSRVGGGGLDVVTPGGRRPMTPPDGDALYRAALSGETIVFDNPRTLSKVAEGLDPTAGRWLSLLGSLPLSRITVATKALSGKFWHPDGEPTRLRHWADHLGVSPDEPWGFVELLDTGHAGLAQSKWAERIAKLEDGIHGSLEWGTSGVVMNGVYTAMSSAHACADGYLALDRTRVGERIVTGESCRITVEWVGHSSVRARLSSPCKAKTGDLMLFDMVDSPGSARLDHIGWDSSANSLYGTFSKPDSGVRGFKELLRSVPGDVWVVSEKPYASSPRSGSSWWANPHSTAPAISRIVPADVLAAASA